MLLQREWSDHLTEDIELQMELLLDGMLVAYAPDAVVEAEMPDTLEGARTQNERWERGRIDLARRYVPQLVRLGGRSDRRRRVAAIDGVLDHLVPPLSVLVAATGGVGGRRNGRLAAAPAAAWPQSGWALVGALVVHVVSGLVLAKAPCVRVPIAPARARRWSWWKVQLWLRMLVRPGAEGWARTARDRNDRRPVVP